MIRSTVNSRQWLPRTLLVAGLLLTFIASAYVTRTARLQERSKQQRSLQAATHELQGQIESRLNGYISILRGGSALFASEGNVSRRTFHQYVYQLDLDRNYQGATAVGFTPRVAAAELPDLARRANNEGIVGFHVWPEPAGGRDVFPVFYVETAQPRPIQATGFDLSSESLRRRAMESARDTGEPASTELVQLIGLDPAAPPRGFLTFVPVYRGGDIPATVQDRRLALSGFVYSPFRCDELMSSIAKLADNSITFELVDPASSPDSLMYPERPTLQGRSDTIMVPVSAHGVHWTLLCGPRTGLNHDDAYAQGALVLSLGTALSLGLFFLIRAQAQARAAAEEAKLAAERTSLELRRSEEALRVSLDFQKRGEEDRARLLESEKTARAEAEAANRTKDEFLATLSHELRTPLNAILGWAQLLRLGGMEAEEVDRGLEAIERNSRVQAQLVEDLLDVSRIISGKIRLDLRPIDLSPVIEAALDSVRPAAAAKRIRVIPVLEAQAGPVLGDADRLQQVVWNLLSNAIKFTPAGGRVDVYLQREDGNAQIIVCDTGQGIAPEFLPYVFERLRQADASSTRRHGGLGLGLAIVRHLVELQGGHVAAQSRGVNRGATFIVSLPISTTRRPIENLSRRPHGFHDGDSDNARLAGTRVLVVEDEADARELLGRVLLRAGASVAVASSASEALAAFDHSPPEVLISDISMPEEDGYSLIRKIRLKDPSRGGRCAALALTAFARDEDRRAASDAGFDAHMAKPFDPGDLIDTAARLVHRDSEASNNAPTKLTAPSA